MKKTKRSQSRPASLNEVESFYDQMKHHAEKSPRKRSKAASIRAILNRQASSTEEPPAPVQSILPERIVQSWDVEPGKTPPEQPAAVEPQITPTPPANDTRPEIPAMPPAQQQSYKPRVIEAGTFRLEPLSVLPSHDELVDDVRRIRDPQLEVSERNSQTDLKNRMLQALSKQQSAQKSQGEIRDSRGRALSNMDLVADIVEMTNGRVRAKSSPKDWPDIKQLAISKARHEWQQVWNSGNKQEDEADVRDALLDYWRAGTGMGRSGVLSDYRQRFMKAGDEKLSDDQLISNYFTEVAWSAAFISWVMQSAGTTPEFETAPSHVKYVAGAKKNAVNQDMTRPVWALDATVTAPQVGDIVVKARNNSGATFQNVDDGTHRDTHGDIVVEATATGLKVIGGNAQDSATGKLHTVGQSDIALNNGMLPSGYFAIVRIMTNGAQMSTSPTPMEQTLELQGRGASSGRRASSGAHASLHYPKDFAEMATAVITATATNTNPGGRPCCALGQWLVGGSGSLDPTALGGHHYGTGGGPTGYVYTAKAGLVDLGHVRDTADMTKFVYDSLVSGATRLELYEGVANVHAIPPNSSSIIELAGAIAYAESWAHELTTWATFEQDFSSFSPEDIPSNIIGIELGKRAVAISGSFDAAVDKILDTLINSELEAQPKANTDAVLAKIKGSWFDVTMSPPFLMLLRRNFDGTTWMADMLYDAPATFGWLSPVVFEPFYSEFSYAITGRVDGKSGITLATMKATTNAIRSAFVAANPGMDKP